MESKETILVTCVIGTEFDVKSALADLICEFEGHSYIDAGCPPIKFVYVKDVSDLECYK